MYDGGGCATPEPVIIPGAQPLPKYRSVHSGAKEIHNLRVALRCGVVYDSLETMTETSLLPCDGCGQLASQEHINKRLERLEWTTRYRPVHIGTLLLGGVAPASDAEFVYSPGGEFAGEGGRILTAAAVARDGRSMEAVLGEFQRGGFLLTYLLECPLEPGTHEPSTVQTLLRERLPIVLARIRRSLKPKRIIPISRVMEPLVLDLAPAGCPIVLDGTKPFDLDAHHDEPSDGYLRKASGA